MTTNPFTANVDALQRESSESSAQLWHWREKIDWFQGFNLDQEALNLKQAERAETELRTRLTLEKQKYEACASLLKKLEHKAGMGFDPRHWFSSERAIAKRQLVEARRDYLAQRSKLEQANQEVSKASEISRDIRTAIDAAREFDPLLARSAILGLQAILDRNEPELTKLRQRRDDLDEVLREPLESLRKLEAERDHLTSQISRAEYFDSALTDAPNGRERAQIHAWCEKDLGESKPGNVLRRSKSALRQVDHKLEKLRARINGLIRFATWDIRHIVVDGNNLCYEGSRFLGLCVLESLVPALAKKYKVTVIFDASIRRRLKLGTEDIKTRLAQAEQVHIVASKRKADETVLAVASDDPQTFVLSNDRYDDYPEKAAVKEERVLRHEIVGQAVYIHDLHIATKIEPITCTP